MDEELKNRMDIMDSKIDAIYKSTEKTRKYFLAVLIITVVAFVVPLFGLVFAVPSLISTYSEISTL